MSLTKRQIIEEAFAELGLSPEFYDLTPGQYQRAMTRLDLMVADMQNNAIRIAYALASPPGSGDLDDDSLVPDVSLGAVILNLSLQIAPMFGKAPSTGTMQNAKNAYDNLMQNAVAQIPQIKRPQTLPYGAGTKYWRWGNRNPFFPIPAETETGGAEEQIEYPPSYQQTQGST